MEPFHGKAKLVSPAVTNGGGVQWLQQFFGNCTGCHIDAIALHWYDTATVSTDLFLICWVLLTISSIRTGAISQDISLTLIRCSRAILSGLPSLLVLAPPNSSSPSLNMYYLGWRPRTLSNVMLVSVRFFLLYLPNRSEVFPSLSGDFAGIYVNSNGSLTDLGITYASTVEPPYGWNSSCSSNS